MAGPISYPKFAAVDLSGNPLSLGKVYSYAPGTLDVKDTFFDSNYTTPHTNPIVLDERGECILYVSGATDLFLFDKDGNEIWGPIEVGGGIGSVNINVNTTITTNLVMDPGDIYNIASGVTLTINGSLTAGAYQIFNCIGTGKVFFGNKVGDVLPEWWWNGIGDIGPAMQAAINSRTTVPNPVLLSNSSYTFNTGVTAGTNVNIRGLAYTGITFEPASTATLFDFVNTPGGVSATVWRSSLENVYLVGSGNETKTFIRLMDVRQFRMEQVTIYDITPSNSIGLLFKGRDTSGFRNIWITADRPIVVGENPTATSAKIVFDGTQLGPNILTSCNDATVNGINIEFLDEDMYMPSLKFDGIYMSKGISGITFGPTTLIQSPQNWNIANCRYEQSDAGGRGLSIAAPASKPLYSLNLLNNTFSGTTGIYLRNIVNTTITEEMSGTDTVNTTYLDVNTSCESVITVNCDWNYGVISLGGLRTAFATELNSIRTAGGRWFAHYVNAQTGTANKGITINDTNVWYHTEVVADDGYLSLPTVAAGVWLIEATAYNVAGGAGQYIAAIGGISGITKLGSSTASTEVNVDPGTDGLLCLIWNTAPPKIRNRLGYQANIIVRMTFKPV